MAWNDWATKWWKKDKKKEKKTSASSYWYDDYSSDFDYKSFYKGWDGVDEKEVTRVQRSQDLYKLNATRRAISNFVNIVTGRNIPVTYATRSNSLTDGVQVILSADVNDHFDVGVGLALHEGSHIVLSDFKLLKVIDDAMLIYRQFIRDMDNNNAVTTKMVDDSFLNWVANHRECTKYTDILTRLFTHDKGLARYRKVDSELIKFIHSLTNWIEDRRIDSFIYRSAPGYRQYYLTMYDYYFNSKEITKGLESDEYRTEDVESYMFRIINFTNEKTDLNALKELRRIYGMIDLKNIGRFKNTTEVMGLAIDIAEVILDRIGKDADLGQKGQPQQGEGEGEGQNEIEITDVTDGESDEQGGTQGGKGMSGQATLSTNPSKSAGSGVGDKDVSDTKITISKTAMEKLKRAFEKQKKFLDNDVKKKNLSKDEAKSLKNIEESDSQLVNVGADVNQHDYYGRGSGKAGKGIDCVVVKRVKENIMDSDDFPFSVRDGQYDEEVANGIKFGTILGNKLKVRSESRDTVFNRLNKGKIDQRLISGLGYGAESVFYTKEVDQYNKANLHISVDYSGSMQGERLRKAVTVVTAIVKAAQMSRNINVQVSIRSTTTAGRNQLPYIAMIYDSRTDSFSRFTKLISKIGAGNTTPEGLCYEATMKHFVQSSKDVDSYFLNLSDGEPGFQGEGFNYQGEEAAVHTAKQIKRMKEMGINVLSYFIGSSAEPMAYSRSWEIFRKCYGSDAKWIDTRNMVAVAKTMNELFLKKGVRE